VLSCAFVLPLVDVQAVKIQDEISRRPGKILRTRPMTVPSLMSVDVAAVEVLHWVGRGSAVFERLDEAQL
jgi:hypothetical protein